LKDSILGNVVKVVSHDQDRYDRTIGDIYHDGTLINLSLVEADLAWHYMKYAPDDTALREGQQQAREMNNASNSAMIAGDNTVQYDTTKAAVTGLTRGLARAHADDGIRVNALCPGPTFTPWHARRADAAGKTHSSFKEEFGQPTMLRRAANPREIAACIVFLASDDASFVTGSCLVADGGESAM